MLVVGIKKYLGIWVAKFEASEEESGGVNFLPGVSSLRNLNIGDMYTRSEDYNTKLNSHMVKNSEWGAVAYLSYSNYGIGSKDKISINNSKDYYTGGSNDTKTIYSTNVNQSTTGNEYGVFDMKGCCSEYVAAYVNNGNSKIRSNGKSLTKSGEEDVTKSTNKVTVYEASNSKTEETVDDQGSNYDLSGKNNFGDALYETSTSGTVDKGWQGGVSQYPYQEKPFFLRSGIYNNVDNGGNFYFYLSGRRIFRL